MASLDLKVDQLRLDHINPRINSASNQREALQRILDDQGVKLFNLAESIAYEGLSPMDRLLVIENEADPETYIVLEGNRRLAALKILRNPSVLTDIVIAGSLKARFEKLALQFDLNSVEPISCFSMESRPQANSWIMRRHTGQRCVAVKCCRRVAAPTRGDQGPRSCVDSNT
jgi:hypothetical protein